VQAVMTLRRLAADAAAGGERAAEAPLPLIFVAILSGAMSLALSILLGWHVYLVATSQASPHFC